MTGETSRAAAGTPIWPVPAAFALALGSWNDQVALRILGRCGFLPSTTSATGNSEEPDLATTQLYSQSKKVV